MKNSGIEWIGEIPDSWDISRVKNCFYLSKTKARQKDPVVLRLARSGVHVKDVTTNEGQMAESYEDYNPVCVGDLLLNPMDLYSGANCNVSEVEGVISPAYQNLRKKIELNPKYFDYYFKIQYWTMAMFAHGKGISFDNRWTINSETILNYYLPFPSLDEQNKIVLALNNKLSQVDELIANQQGQIEKLKEYKQSVITEAVTKGLDKSAPLKDSGIDWIGEIPENQGIARLKQWIKIINGYAFKSDSFQKEGDITVIRIGDIKSDIDFQNCVFYNQFNGQEQYLIRKNDILMAMSGATYGKITYISNDIQGLKAINQRVGIIRGKNNGYNKYIFQAKVFFDYLDWKFMGSAQPNISAGDILEFPVVYFDYETQKKIADYLDEKCGKIDEIISIKQRKIEKLQEYKKSLIYEYVTGKKEVV